MKIDAAGMDFEVWGSGFGARRKIAAGVDFDARSDGFGSQKGER